MNNQIIYEDQLKLSDVQKYRETVRAIVMNQSDQVMMIYSKKFSDYTFTGGGIKQHETHEQALKRELLEEIGASHIDIIDYLMSVDEIKYGLYDDKTVYLQRSHYYAVKIHTFGKTELSLRESWHGIQPVWIDMDDAIIHNQSVMNDINHQQTGLKTVLKREEIILKTLKEKTMRKFEIIERYANQNPSLPSRATEGSAGYDLSSLEDVTIEPKQIKLIPTGLKVFMPKDEALFVFPRSSLAIKKGLMMSNSVGIIDADYYGNKDNDGHIMVPLMNIKDEAVTIMKGERIAQGVFMPYLKTSDDEAKSQKRHGGFGSSGH